METDQAELIYESILGNETALTQLILEHQTNVFRLALSIMDDPDEANDITQETIIAAINALEKFQKGTSFKAWLYTITLNACRSRLRKRKVLGRLNTALAGLLHINAQALSSPEDRFVEGEMDMAVWQALESLDEKHRIPLILRYYHELSTKEIAEILNIKDGTVHSRLSIGRDRLRNKLKDTLRE